jgi:hypothetical protein
LFDQLGGIDRQRGFTVFLDRSALERKLSEYRRS